MIDTAPPGPDAGISHPLVERYVAAFAARLPADQRTDVADELRGSILDTLEDRLEQPDADREAVVHDVLLELGDPARLARSYTTGPRHLVGPEHYDAWRGLVLAISLVAAPVTALVTLVVGIWTEEPYPEAILGSVWTGLSVVVHVAFWVTLVFWIIERTGAEVPEEEAWTPDRLPPLPSARALGVKELVGGVGFVAIVLAWLPWQHFRSPLQDDAGERLPMLDPVLWTSGWLWAFVALLLVEVAVEAWKFSVGNWTRAVTAGVVLLNVAFTAFVIAMVSTQQLLGDGLLARASDPAALDLTVDRIVAVVAVVVGLMSVWEAVRGHLAHRTRQARQA